MKLGVEVGAPMELSYSCYKGGDKHCGVCESCMRRKRAFKQLGIDDLTEYESYSYFYKSFFPSESSKDSLYLKQYEAFLTETYASSTPFLDFLLLATWVLLIPIWPASE